MIGTQLLIVPLLFNVPKVFQNKKIIILSHIQQITSGEKNDEMI